MRLAVLSYFSRLEQLRRLFAQSALHDEAYGSVPCNFLLEM